MSLTKFITERLKITSKTKPLRLQPTSKDELKAIIDQELKQQGPDADLNHIDTSEITDMSELFKDLDPRNIQIDQWNTSNVTNMNSMFIYCRKFNCDGLGSWDMSNVRDMSNMFKECKNFNCDLSDWKLPKITSLYLTFYKCSNFTGTGLENWDVSNINDMSYAFTGCKLLNCDLSHWDVSNVSHMEYAFKECESLDCDLGSWDVSNVSDMSYAFYKCKNLHCDLSSWRLSKFVGTNKTFGGCTKMTPALLPKFPK